MAQWNAGQDATRQATAQHQQAEQQAGTSLPFDDTGEAGRRAARDILDNARHQLDGAGDSATGTVGSARDKAPKKPGFWSKVGDFFEDVGAGLANAGGHVVNGLASFGNAMIHHPGDTAAMAGRFRGVIAPSGTSTTWPAACSSGTFSRRRSMLFPRRPGRS